MNSQSDQQLLREYISARSEPAFTELVRRHTDLVYSAALRMVCDAHLAEDVAQGVFVALAQNARQLTERPVLSGWLHRTAQNLAAKTVRSDVRRRAREQEAATMNELLSADPDTLWQRIAPQLDAALGELSEPDRDALMLRYFERKSARDMAQTLGVSDDAAQKRVSRAVERLREFLAKRGVTVGASGLVVALSANSVQAAPAGLSASFAMAALAGATSTASTAAATVTGASLATMTTLKIGLIGAAAAAAALTAPLVLQHQNQARLQAENEGLRQQMATQPAPQAAAETAAAAGAGALSAEQLREVLRLQAEVARLRQEAQDSALARAGTNEPMTAEVTAWLARVNELKAKFDERPDLKIPELQFLTPRDWLNVALDARPDTDTGARQAFDRLRSAAKQAFTPMLRKALNGYVAANGGQLPSDVSQLKPYFSAPVDDAVLERYQVVRSGEANAESAQDPVIAEKQQVDPDFDSLLSVGLNGASMKGEGGGSGFGFSSRSSSASGFGGGTNAFGTGTGAFRAGSGTRGTSSSFFFDSRSGVTNVATPQR